MEHKENSQKQNSLLVCILKCNLEVHIVNYSHRVIMFRLAFSAVLYYLYTDQTPHVTPVTCLLVLELANRMVLPRLVTMIETSVITQLRQEIEHGEELFIEALELLQPCQMFNAAQLAQWCLAYIGQNYLQIYERFIKLISILQF